MLFGNLLVETFVCLSCGEYFSDNEVSSEKVGKLTLPKGVKENGKFFKMFTCPHCASVYVGFVPSKKQSTKYNNSCSTRQNDECLDGLTFETIDTEVTSDEKKVVDTKKENDINKDDFANFKQEKTKEKHKKTNQNKRTKRKARQSVKIIKCTSCGEKVEVGSGHTGTFGTKCKKCLNKLMRGGR